MYCSVELRRVLLDLFEAKQGAAYAPDGSGARRDRAAFEAEINGRGNPRGGRLKEVGSDGEDMEDEPEAAGGAE